MVVAPNFHRSGKVWRPAKMTGLPRLTREEAGLTLQLQALIPDADRGRLLEAIRARLEDVAQEKVGLEVVDVSLVSPAALARQLTDPALLATLSLAPHLPRAVLEVELGLSHAMVDLLLGGAGETVALRALSDIEEGVVSFVLLEALRAVAAVRGTGGNTVQLEGMLRGAADALALLGQDGPLLVLQLRVAVGAQPGHARLVVPFGALPRGPESLTGETFAAAVRAHLPRLSSLRTELRCSIGRAELTLADVRQLGPGDVVLLEEASARPDLGQGGKGWLEVGLGRRFRLEADLALEGGTWKATVTAFHPGEQGYAGTGPTGADGEAEEALRTGAPREKPRPEPLEASEVTHPEAGGGGGMSGTSDGAELLGDVPLQLTVELARLPMTADAVVALRVGQVVDLQRTATEPVELSVNGKVVARGELVEIEGQLGVRVQSLVG